MAQTLYPNQQSLPAAALPVRLSDGASFYTAGGGGSSAPYVGTPLGYQQLSGSGVMALTVPNGATYALITIEANDVRWRDDTTNPSATVGMPLMAGTTDWQYTGNLANLKFIAQTGSTTLNVSYYK